MKKSFAFLPLSLALLSAFAVSPARASVWETTRQWDDSAEAEYRSWVASTWYEDFFDRAGTYQNLKLDCADAVYSMRVIFAAEHGLPIAIKDATGGSRPITNEMSRFDNLPTRGARVRAFLQYIYGLVATTTLSDDTYPVSPDKNGVRPGTLILTDHAQHHSWTIQNINRNGIPHLVFSSRPAKTHLWSRDSFPTEAWSYPTGLANAPYAGIRAFRQPQYLNLPEFRVPGYSSAQFEIPHGQLFQTIEKRLAQVAETRAEQVKRLLGDACKGASDRVKFVQDGLAFLKSTGGERCMTSTEYDDYSTPGRDSRFLDSVNELIAVYRQSPRGSVAATVAAQVEDVIAGGNKTCPVTYAPGKSLGLGAILKRGKAGLLSSNPHDPVEYRWGDKPGHGPLASRCPTF